MEISQEKLVAFAQEVETLIERKKDAAKMVTEAFDGFCKENDGIKKKPLKKAVADFLKWQKDRQKYLDEVNEADLLIDVLTGEKCIAQTIEEE